MKSLYLAPCALLLLVSAAGCATSNDTAWQDSRPLGKTVPAYRPPESPSIHANQAAEAPAPSSELSLREALALALLHNPDLRVFAWEVRAQEALTLQAGLLPNPEVGADFEDFAGTGPLRGTGATEVTLGLSQLIELGGDRRRRQDVAARQRDLAGWDYETIRLDVFTETMQAFTAVLAAQERLNLADSLLGQAQQFYRSVAARVEAGKVSALEERRAQVVLATTRIAYERTVRELTADRARLATMWGSPAPTFDRVVGDLASVDVVPPHEQLVAFLEQNPDIARWRDEMSLRRAAVALEKARRVPNPVFFIGARRIREIGETALTAGVSIPIPFFDRNQGSIKEAEYRIRQAEEAQKSAQVEAHRMLSEAYGQLATAYIEVTSLRRDVLPAARENFAAIEVGYREGKFDLLMVLDAQRTLFETTNQYVTTLAAYHTTRAEVERLIGTPLSSLNNE